MMKNFFHFAALAAAVFGLQAGVLCAPKAPTAYAVIESTPRQEIKGWGLFPAYSWPRDEGTTDKQQSIFSEARKPIRDALYNELRPTIIRVDIPWNFCNDDATHSLRTENLAALVAHLKAARAHGITKYITAFWSPPVFFKGPQNLDQPKHELFRSRVTVGGAQTNTFLLKDKLGAYAHANARVLQYLTQQVPEMKLVGHSVQNEPNLGSNYPNNAAGCSFQNPETGLPADAANWQELIKATRAELDKIGLQKLVLMAPEGEGYYLNDDPPFLDAKFEALKRDPALSQSFQAFASHSYANDGILHRVREYSYGVQQSPGKEVWMTEYCLKEADSKNGGQMSSMMSIEGVLKTARHLAGDMSFVPNNYWIWWRGWTNKPSDKISYEDLLLGEFGPNKPSVIERTKVFYFLKTLWNAVPGEAGWKVRPMTSFHTALTASQNPDLKWQEIDMTTFSDAGNKRMVTVLANWQTTAQALQLKGLVGKSAQVFRSTKNEDMARQSTLAIKDNAVNLSLPPQSVTVLVTQ